MEIPTGALTLTGLTFFAQMGPLTGALTLTGSAPDVTIGLMKVEMQFTTGVWTNVTNDLAARMPLTLRYGISGQGPLDRVADVGTCSFAMRNDPANSLGLRGAYSPEHANARVGFGYGTPVRVTFCWDGQTYRKWRGKIVDIRPQPGQFQGQATLITAHDWMDEAGAVDITRIALQVGKRSDEVLQAILDVLPEPPTATDLDVGVDTYSHALHDLGRGRVSATELFQAIAQSELGFVTIQGDQAEGGLFAFRNRNHRAAVGISAFMDDDTIIALQVPTTLDQIYNDIEVTTHAKRVDTSVRILFDHDAVPQLTAGQSTTIWGAYRDPDQEARSVGGLDMVAPVATTDYLMNAQADGLGADLTANLSVTATYFAAAVKLELTNTGGSTGHVTKLQCRGKGVYDYAPLISRAVNATSQASFGRRTLDVDMPYQESPTLGQAAADYLVTLYGDVGSQIEYLDFIASASPALLTLALQREPGDRLAVTETQTGLDVEAFIHAVELEVTPKDFIKCRWLLAPAVPLTAVWILDDPVASILGQSTILGLP